MSLASHLRIDRANAAIDALTVGEFLELVQRRTAAIDHPPAVYAIMRLGWAIVRIAEGRAAEVEAKHGRA